MPALPARGLPVDPDALLLDMARVDCSGRVSARGLLRALGWHAGHRVDTAAIDGAVVIASAATGLHAVTTRGEIALPAAARQLCGITVPGPQVLLATSPAQDVIVVHPARTLARLLVEHHTNLTAGEPAGEEVHRRG